MAMRALSRNEVPCPYYEMLDYAQKFTASINWKELNTATSMLKQSKAFDEDENVTLCIISSD